MLKFITSYFKYKYLLYFFALVAGWPCVFYLLGWLPHYTICYVILFVLTVATALNKNIFSRVPKPIAIIIFVQIFVWLLYATFYLDSSYLTRVFLLIITFNILVIQLSYRDKYEFIRTYNFWLTFQVVSGTIGFVLVLSGLLQPLSQFIQMDGRLGYFYGLFTTNAVFEDFIRNAGFYDEPGALACWGVFALLFNKLFINNKKIEYLLVFGLISTISLAYFIQVFAYLFFFYKNQRKKILLPTVLFFLVLSSIASFSEGLNDALFGRFLYDTETEQIAGDNRSELFERSFNIFKTAPIFGVGATNLSTTISYKEGFVGGNFFFNWASDGLFGVLITYIPLIFLLQLGQRKRQYRYAVIIIFLGYLQRPYTDTQLLYPLIQFTFLLFAYLDIHGHKLIQRKLKNH